MTQRHRYSRKMISQKHKNLSEIKLVEKLIHLMLGIVNPLPKIKCVNIHVEHKAIILSKYLSNSYEQLFIWNIRNIRNIRDLFGTISKYLI